MRASLLALFCLPILTMTAQAQWNLQDSHTTASLRGIHAINDQVAWASGTNGTDLHTNNGGTSWQTCTTPPDADKLDFRGIQAFDQNTAIVMSSGKGDLSRLYKTTDACHTWKLLFSNPDKEGFWDALLFVGKQFGVLVGDPVRGGIYLARSDDGGRSWVQQHNPGLHADPKSQSLFAASNSSTAFINGFVAIGSGGLGGAHFYREDTITICLDACSEEKSNRDGRKNKWVQREIPIGTKTETSGIFSFDLRPDAPPSRAILAIVAVGGDYKKQDDASDTAAYSLDRGQTWNTAQSQPHGYRSAVAYDPTTKTWITVGPSGTDISVDDGKNWRALKPNPSQPADADKNWNALSLPFVVGPNGRIGKLRDDALNP